MEVPKTPDQRRPAAGEPPKPPFVLRLFVAGMTSRSTRAVANIRAICEEHVPGAYVLEVVNLHAEPASAQREQIVAAPTCVKQSPLPARRVIGDMSDTPRVLTGLGLPRR
jgi:circadian clock protein KaiB